MSVLASIVYVIVRLIYIGRGTQSVEIPVNRGFSDVDGNIVTAGELMEEVGLGVGEEIPQVCTALDQCELSPRDQTNVLMFLPVWYERNAGPCDVNFSVISASQEELQPVSRLCLDFSFIPHPMCLTHAIHTAFVAFSVFVKHSTSHIRASNLTPPPSRD